MKFIIHKGKHRSRPFRFGLWWNKECIRKCVTFCYGCNYSLPGEDQQDTNKLFGIGYLWSPHDDSARFGWLYVGDNKVQINAYLYMNGKRIIKQLCAVSIGFKMQYELLINPGFYTLKVTNWGNGFVMAEEDFPFTHNKKISYPLNLYFGGNQVAPNDIEIEMKKI